MKTTLGNRPEATDTPLPIPHVSIAENQVEKWSTDRCRTVVLEVIDEVHGPPLLPPVHLIKHRPDHHGSDLHNATFCAVTVALQHGYAVSVPGTRTE
jgi:hypothetical protein